MYENKTRLELIEELAALEDHFDAKVMETAAAKVKDYQSYFDEFLAGFEKADMDSARYAMSKIVEWNNPKGSRLGIVRGAVQYISAIGHDYPIYQNYFHSDKTGRFQRLSVIHQKAKELKYLIDEYVATFINKTTPIKTPLRDSRNLKAIQKVK